jgi:hypothetical protein
MKTKGKLSCFSGSNAGILKERYGVNVFESA